MTAPGTDHLAVSAVDGAMTLRLNRPEKLNAITAEMRAAIVSGVEIFARSPELRVLVLRSSGRYFSAGADIGAGRAMPQSNIELRDEFRRMHRLADELERVEKPVVAAMQGPCLGGALELVLSCDFRLAAESAAFGLPEIEIGVIPGGGGTSRLTQLVGRGWARWLVMANEKVDARRALTMGLVHDVYPDSEFDARVDAFVRKLAGLPSEVMALAKTAIDLSASTDRDSARSIERIANAVLIRGEEHKAAVEAFRQRKKTVKPDKSPP